MPTARPAARVVALGGNALLKRGEPLEADIQRQNIEQAARTIAGASLCRRRCSAMPTARPAARCRAPAPRATVLLIRGMIGYMLQQALKNNLPQREVSVLLTQVEVDAADLRAENVQRVGRHFVVGAVLQCQQPDLRPVAVHQHHAPAGSGYPASEH
jgi:carbamate kinase